MEIPNVESSVLVLIDFQERLVPVMDHFDATLSRARLLLDGAAALGLNVIVTEQYPRGLGATIPEIAEHLPMTTPILSKTSFSVFGEPAFRTALESKYRKTVVIAGIETHVCVLQSVFDALNAGYQVILAEDAVTSRKPGDRAAALTAARHAGACVLSAEAILFWLLRDASHPAFKAISRLVR